MKIALITNLVAANGAPTAVTDGHPILRYGSGGAETLNYGFADQVEEAEIVVTAAVTGSTVGSIAYVRLWAWFPDAYGTNKWCPLGTGAAADKGKLNSPVYTLEETGTDIIRHAERVVGFGDAARLYAEVGTLTNVTRVDVVMVARG